MINLIVQSFGFLLLFTAYQSLQNLQSSINDDRNIGQTSLAVLYGVLILSCPFLAPVVMGLFANGAYLTELAIKYAQVSKENLSVVITRFFGIFFGIFQTSQIWGNLISSLVLQQGADRPDLYLKRTCLTAGLLTVRMPAMSASLFRRVTISAVP
ncbi:Protein unc-93 A [Branchiostoma belcheri]|nr:Protein unc-93 A [Branchiostoma belcheri]